MDFLQNNFKWNYQDIKIPFIETSRNDYSSDIREIIFNQLKKNKNVFSLFNPRSKNSNLKENKTLPQNEKTKNPFLIINSIKINRSQDKLKIPKSKPIKTNFNSNENNTITYKTNSTQTTDEIEVPKKIKEKKYSFYNKTHYISDIKNNILNFDDKNFKTINKINHNYNYNKSNIVNNKSKNKVSSIETSLPDCPIKKKNYIKKECAIKYINFDCTENNKIFNNFFKYKKLKKTKENSKTSEIFEKNVGKLRKNSKTENFYNCFRNMKRYKTAVNKKRKLYDLNANQNSNKNLLNNNKTWKRPSSNINFTLYNNNKKVPWIKKNYVTEEKFYEYNSANPRISLQTFNLIKAVNSS